MRRAWLCMAALAILLVGCGGPKDDTLGAGEKDESQKGAPDMAGN